MWRCATARHGRGRERGQGEGRACRRSRCPTGRERPRRPKRGRRGRWRRRRSPSTTNRAAAERGDARRGAARDADPPAARAACPPSTPDAPRGSRRSLARAVGGRRRCGGSRAKSSSRSAASSPIRASSALFGAGLARRSAARRDLPDGRVIAGTVDRLLVEDDRVSVIDFKTGRVPASDADIPDAHRAQMQAYAEALRVIFPGRRGQRGAALHRRPETDRTHALRAREPSAHMPVNL